MLGPMEVLQNDNWPLTMSFEWKDLQFWQSETWWNIRGKLIEGEYQPKRLFRALELTPFDQIRVVILGQDPYPTKGLPDGLAFSVRPEQRDLPMSLRDIFHEYITDTGFPYPHSGDLSVWARRGVLLLNTVFSIPSGGKISHTHFGWQELTREILTTIGDRHEDVVFILWGNAAQHLALPLVSRAVAEGRVSVISSPHPSPLSARRGFFFSRPFTRANALLRRKIDWKLP